MKTKILVCTIFCCLLFSSSYSQSKFSRYFYQTLGEKISTNSVIETLDGGYVIGGEVKDSAAGSLPDIFLAKFNSLGDTIWTNRIAASVYDGIYDLAQTNDGGFILVGGSDSYGSVYGNVLLLKTDSLGNPSWAKLYSKTGFPGVEGFSVRQNADSGYIIAARIFSPINKSLFIRTNSVGDTLWTKIFDYGADSKGYFAEEIPSGGFIIALEADSVFSGGMFMVISKLSSSGIPIWTKKVRSFGFSLDRYEIKQTIDGGFLLASEDYFFGADLMILKFDSNGNLVFGKNFHPTFMGYLHSLDATQLTDSTYRIVASFFSSLQSTQVIGLALNQQGDIIFSKEFSNKYFGYGGTFTNNGEYVTLDPLGGIHKLDTSFDMECISAVQSSCTYFDYTSSSLTLHDSTGVFQDTSGTFTSMNNIPRKLYTPCTPNIPVCVVTVDSASQKNLVVWEENFDTTFIDSYEVYKESAAAGIYNLIGSVPQNQLSTFLDTASNPAAQSDRYRVSALWHSYYEPPNNSVGHKTIHLLVSPGIPPTMNLSWSNYEGFIYPTYNVWRGNGISSSIIASLPFGTNNYTDLNPPVGDSLYYIEVVHAPCNPTFRFGNGGGGNSVFSAYNGTLSNRFNTSLYFVGINDHELNSGISISPVPASNELIIIPKNFHVTSVIIINTLGQHLTEYRFNNQNDNPIQLDVMSIPPGVYSLQVFGSDNKKLSKLFVKY